MTMRTFNYVGRYSENTFFCTRKLFQRSGTKLSDIQIFGNLYYTAGHESSFEWIENKMFWLENRATWTEPVSSPWPFVRNVCAKRYWLDRQFIYFDTNFICNICITTVATASCILLDWDSFTICTIVCHNFFLLW